jgi:hypothetical protein
LTDRPRKIKRVFDKKTPRFAPRRSGRKRPSP